MKKLQSTLPNMLLVLTLIAVVAAVALAYVNSITKDPIKENERIALAEGIDAVLNVKGAVVEQTDTIKDEKGKVASIIYHTDNGVAVQAVDHKAFGGDLVVLVGFADDGSIKGYTILETHETPGLGEKAGKWFQADGKGSIIGKQAGSLTVSKDGGDVDAITASTITSRAFLRAVNAAYQTYSEQTMEAIPCE
ncbi:MAG: RnfABCDGE type electron transport complex subunit G [Bacteroidaceae bacterium]|nr:RnfABCDGE type electron transport complex subunit G [Bacteroidaceae bacterium]